jgi:MFS family permease
MAGPLLAFSMCVAEMFSMLSFSSFQALVETFKGEWHLTNTDAGWISGIYFAGYVAGVPFLSSLTDRVDPKRVMLFALIVGGLASLGFAIYADGFWSAMLFRCLQGVGLAGTYMPGLKALSDQTEGSPRQSRYVAFYTASFGIGAGLSYPLAGEVTALLDWRWAFAMTAIGSVIAFAILMVVLPRSKPHPVAHDTHLLDFRPVLRNRQAMSYILGYAGHNWELFAYRSWIVAFLVFAADQQSVEWTALNATTLAAVATLLGVPASIFGNEMAVRFGRRRLILIITALSILMGSMLGFSSGVSYTLAVILCMVYGALLTGDSASITAGTVSSAAPGQRGATLAMHAFIGFMGGIFAPPAVGLALDLFGGRGEVTGWGMAFIICALGSVMAFIAVARQRK